MDETNQKFKTFLQMIALAASGASGRTAYRSDEIDWNSVIQYAQEQAVLPLIGCALMNDADMHCPYQLREQLLQMVRGISGVNLVRRQRAIQLISEMEASGLHVKLIKGYAVGESYVHPEVRNSTDVDILIDRRQEMQVYSFLSRNGFSVSPRGRTEHHAVCLHPKLGKLEVHVQLYNEMVSDTWFRKIGQDKMIDEAPVALSCDGMTYMTLGYTDHLIFLTLHLIKHFIHSGINVRMMVDVAQFFSCHKEEINAVRYWKLMKELHFITLVNCIFWIMIDTKCFAYSDFPMLQQERPKGIDFVLQDLIDGGNMGAKERNRILTSYEYTRLILRGNRNQQQYQIFMLKHKFRSAYHQIFPEKSQMEDLYPILQKQKWLLPFLRLHRIIAYPWMKIRSGVLKEQIRRDTDQLPSEAKRRIEMFVKLDMLSPAVAKDDTAKFQK